MPRALGACCRGQKGVFDVRKRRRDGVRARQFTNARPYNPVSVAQTVVDERRRRSRSARARSFDRTGYSCGGRRGGRGGPCLVLEFGKRRPRAAQNPVIEPDVRGGPSFLTFNKAQGKSSNSSKSVKCVCFAPSIVELLSILTVEINS